MGKDISHCMYLITKAPSKGTKRRPIYLNMSGRWSYSTWRPLEPSLHFVAVKLNVRKLVKKMKRIASKIMLLIMLTQTQVNKKQLFFLMCWWLTKQKVLWLHVSVHITSTTMSENGTVKTNNLYSSFNIISNPIFKGWKIQWSKTLYPFACIFSRIDNDSTAIQATMSEDILHDTINNKQRLAMRKILVILNFENWKFCSWVSKSYLHVLFQVLYLHRAENIQPQLNTRHKLLL